MENNIVQLCEVPAFEKRDFYDSAAPFEWLYRYKENPFLMAQMKERLKGYANSIGVKGFTQLWNSYVKAQKNANGKTISIDNATAYEGQEMELASGRYQCTDEVGVVAPDKMGYDTVICQHPIMPVQRLVNIDNGEERLKLKFRKGKAWRETIVEKSVIASSSGILQLAASGVMVNSENAKQLSTYLFEMENLNYDAIPEQKSVGRLGWVGEGFAPYVEDLVFDGESNFKHMYNAVRANGDFEAWKKAMLELRATRGAGRLFLAASFASALLEPLGLLPFFFHAWGGTEVGKTVGLMIAASVWADPNPGQYITTFNSTGVGQEMMATFLNSLPMCIDELQIQSSAGVKDFDKVIYSLTEGVGRTRGAKTGGLQRVNTWRNCFITNGEHPISNGSSGGGAVNRVIEFECAEKVYHDLHGISNVVRANYGFAGPMFVEWLQQDGNLQIAQETQKNFYRLLQGMDSTDKQAASASAILAADNLVTNLIFQDGNSITVSEMASFMTKKADVDVNARAFDFLSDFIAQNPNRFEKNQYGEYNGEVWGDKKGEYTAIIKTVFDRIMKENGFNGTAFLAWAKRHDLIVFDADRRTKKCRIGDSVPNCVCLKTDDK